MGEAVVTEGFEKRYIDVEVYKRWDGFLVPLGIKTAGRFFQVDRYRPPRYRASRKCGGCGLCYPCMIGGRRIDLFYEEWMDRWFLPAKKNASTP